MMIRLPTTCWISGVSGWKLNQSVTLMASLPTAGVIVLHPGPGAGRVPRPPRGPFGTPLPAAVGSVMKNPPGVRRRQRRRADRIASVRDRPVRARVGEVLGDRVRLARV